MEIRKLARKLRPLMPKEVDHWMRVREDGDPELTAMVDRQIRATARSVLGNYEQKVLLSLPLKSKARGEINLGTMLYESPKWPAGISRGELLQNLAIFGRSGAGKTNVAFHLLRQLEAKRIPFIFLDWKRTARHLLPKLRKPVAVYTPGRSLSPLPFNPFIPPPGLEPQVYVGHVVDVMGDAYTLGDGAKSVLHKAIMRSHKQGCLAPTVDQITQQIEQIPDKERVRGWKISVIRALETLDAAGLGTRYKISQEQLVQTLLRRSSIIELDALSHSSKRFLVPLLALWLYYIRLVDPTREQLNLVIFLEEAHNVLYRQEKRSNEPILSMLLRQCRELGMAFVVVDQHPHLISPAALGNTFTSICLNQKDPRDIAKAAALSLVPDDEKQLFSRLPVGQAVVKLQDRWHEPFLIQVPAVDVVKGSVSDAELSQFVARTGSSRAGVWADPGGSGQKPATLGELGWIRGIQRWDDALNGDELAFVEDVVLHPDDGVAVRYKRLGLSGEKGNRIKLRLLDKKLIEAQTVPIGQTRKIVLRLSRKGRDALGMENTGWNQRESIAHEYWKRYYARRYEEMGYRVRIEAPRKGGRVDVLAEKDGQRIGIEIETGQSNVVANVQNCLRSRFEKVVVVATTKEAFERVEKELGKAGMMLHDRVRIARVDS